MSFETLNWMRVVHLCGMVAWVGGLLGLSFVLRQHAKASKESHGDFVSLEKGIAITMDIGATVAIALGVVLLLSITPTLLKGQGWMHAKLLFATLLIGLHGFQRMRVGKNKRGAVSAEPSWLMPAIAILVVAIIVLVGTRPF